MNSWKIIFKSGHTEIVNIATSDTFNLKQALHVWSSTLKQIADEQLSGTVQLDDIDGSSIVIDLSQISAVRYLGAK